jgi:hypothetical protein
MAVLAEGISVMIRCDRLLAAFGNDWDAFKAIVPNQTLCADNELIRIGFMSPADAEIYVGKLCQRGLIYIADGTAKDLVVVDQLHGPLARCEWIEFGHVNLDGYTKRRVAACRLKGSTQMVVITPEGWTFEESLTASFGFTPNTHLEKSLTFLRHENGLDIYRSQLTGKEVYVARSGFGNKA